MTPSAILFGSIGTLVETSELQRAAFNAAFVEQGLDWVWDQDTYRAMLVVPGGRGRIQAFAELSGIDVDAEALHARKTALFDTAIIERGLHLRPGVADVIDRAMDKGVKLGFCTTTSRANIDAIFTALSGELNRAAFDFISEARAGLPPKPDSAVYHEALRALKLTATEAIAVEDSAGNLVAPQVAGIRVIAFPGENTSNDPFLGAVDVVKELKPSLFGL
ncbi:HAD superfamily hydrolase (TIGR01509 family) [Rubricella aquisinus]|uniref:HAD superfamily hydrolase (TIGR01509 family) n=1 Tax=Rubricella aquisinus TaxID=2028108 RepID=A0A840WLD6_9RHOB|nr:HAD-IA family hydrolase [Rubricella aquisinus]MBB5515341.1 HAD superfamily hydrolase (TIGR01509 family) [Rubricella aquisinus]